MCKRCPISGRVGGNFMSCVVLKFRAAFSQNQYRGVNHWAWALMSFIACYCTATALHFQAVYRYECKGLLNDSGSTSKLWTGIHHFFVFDLLSCSIQKRTSSEGKDIINQRIGMLLAIILKTNASVTLSSPSWDGSFGDRAVLKAHLKPTTAWGWLVPCCQNCSRETPVWKDFLLTHQSERNTL